MNTTKIFTIIIAVSLFTFFYGKVQAKQKQGTSINDTIKLSGKWRFRMDPKDVGAKQNWFSEQFDNVITLPGSMTSNHLGDEISINTPWTGGIEDSSWFHKPIYAKYREAGHIKIPFWLQPEKYYKGVAWYQKEITVPVSWKNKVVELFIERAHWSTDVGQGKLMVSGIDLITDLKNRPEGRQLAFSIKSYMNSDLFNPEKEIELSRIVNLYKMREH